MKRKTSFLLSILAASTLNSLSGMTISEALTQKLVRAEIKWHKQAEEETTSLRHGNNLLVTLHNQSNKTLQVELPEGFLFTAFDSSKQNMLITEVLEFTLLPKQSASKSAHGYCCEYHDAGPAQNERYLIKKPATANLKKLARFVRENKLEGYSVQRAVWCISDKTNLSDINSEDSVAAHKLIGFTGNLLNYNANEINLAHYNSRLGGKQFEKLISLEIPITIDSAQVWIVIQNVNNVTLQTVMSKQTLNKGLFKKQFGVSSIDLGKGEFTVRVYSTDKPVREQKFRLDV